MYKYIMIVLMSIAIVLPAIAEDQPTTTKPDSSNREWDKEQRSNNSLPEHTDFCYRPPKRLFL